MKIAVFSDVHDNLERWREAAEIIKAERVKIGFCCGDIGDLDTVSEVAKSFEILYLNLGNLDFELKNGLDSRRSLSACPDGTDKGERDSSACCSAKSLGMTKEGGNDRGGGLFPENVVFAPDFGEVVLEKRKIAYVHNNRKAKELAESERYDTVFYGHTHTPWEEQIGKTQLINPGEVAGQFGRASFAVFDLKTLKAELKILK